MNRSRPPVSAGDLDQRVTVVGPGPLQRDAAGQADRTPVDLATVWAKVTAVSAETAAAGDADRAAVTHEVWVRRHTAFLSGEARLTLRWRGRLLAVADAVEADTPDGRFHLVTCTERRP